MCEKEYNKKYNRKFENWPKMVKFEYDDIIASGIKFLKKFGENLPHAKNQFSSASDFWDICGGANMPPTPFVKYSSCKIGLNQMISIHLLLVRSLRYFSPHGFDKISRGCRG